MKRIIILCDGTWNRSDSALPTNVVRLGQAILGSDGDGMVQVPIYIQGVGTGQGVSRLSRWMDAVLGGAFGWGLLQNMIDAYRHLVFMYEPGDEIFIFGFSRGAYTARTLAGFIRSTGIIPRDGLHHVPEAVARYCSADPTTHPSHPDSHAFRARLSPQMVTSPAEAEWRAAQGMPADLLRITYLGVWDTVGALGVPALLPAIGRWNARRYRFHDAELSRLVQAARHAVALDETRRTFEPTLWTNLDDLNREHDDPTRWPYQERFFAGDHGSVGGGGDIRALSSIALGWIAEGAAKAGMAFDPHRISAIAAEEDFTGPLRNTSTPPRGLLNRLMRCWPRDRDGPQTLEALHPSVLRRWDLARDGLPPYRPASLRRVADLIGSREPGGGAPPPPVT